jgi:hypothetical protein
MLSQHRDGGWSTTLQPQICQGCDRVLQDFANLGLKIIRHLPFSFARASEAKSCITEEGALAARLITGVDPEI